MDENYLEFLNSIDKSKAAVEKINDFLLNCGCNRAIQEAKSGYTVSYILPNKKTLATFVCRKSGVKMRIYPQNLAKYENFLDTLPESMKKEIIKASVCKRLINPVDCNPKCVKGYEFNMDGERYQKCRYMAFMPCVSDKTAPFIQEFLQNDLSNQ